MEKSLVRKALEQAYPNPQADMLNPDNHDKVHIALGLLSAESAEKLTSALDMLKAQISGLQYTISTVIETQSKKMIESNEKVAESNKRYARAMMWLTGGLVFVGLLQVAALLWQTTLHH